MSDSRESFQVLSPRILLRTDFITHEEIVLQYNRYFLGSNVKLNYPFDELAMTDPTVRADKDVFTLMATMWW